MPRSVATAMTSGRNQTIAGKASAHQSYIWLSPTQCDVTRDLAASASGAACAALQDKHLSAPINGGDRLRYRFRLLNERDQRFTICACCDPDRTSREHLQAYLVELIRAKKTRRARRFQTSEIREIKYLGIDDSKRNC